MSEEETAAKAVLKDGEKRMEGAIGALHQEFLGIRAGRASTAILEPIKVEAYGSTMAISRLATVAVADARLLTVNVWDASMTSAVEKAIANSDLGLTPQVEGNLIRVAMPELSGERRQELAKTASSYAEHAKVAVRNIRRDSMEKLRRMGKDKELSEDLMHDKIGELEKTTNSFVKRIDEAWEKKNSEIIQ